MAVSSAFAPRRTESSSARTCISSFTYGVDFGLGPEYSLGEGVYQENYQTRSGLLFEPRIIGVVEDVIDLQPNLRVFDRLFAVPALNFVQFVVLKSPPESLPFCSRIYGQQIRVLKDIVDRDKMLPGRVRWLFRFIASV